MLIIRFSHCKISLATKTVLFSSMTNLPSKGREKGRTEKLNVICLCACYFKSYSKYEMYYGVTAQCNKQRASVIEPNCLKPMAMLSSPFHRPSGVLSAAVTIQKNIF